MNGIPNNDIVYFDTLLFESFRLNSVH